MAKFPLVTGDEGEVQDLGALARSLRLALLVTDAAMPLFGGPRGAVPEMLGMPERAAADRSRLRGIAFRIVLRELARFEYEVRPRDLTALLEGRVPEPGAPERG